MEGNSKAYEYVKKHIAHMLGHPFTALQLSWKMSLNSRRLRPLSEAALATDTTPISGALEEG